MPAVAARARQTPELTLEQRAAKHRLLVRDAIAISSLLCIAIVLSFVTYLLFRSYSQKRADLGQRWRHRGELALAQGHAATAVNDLRSALEFAPGDEALQTELAQALMQAGSTREATVYFNTLHESRPGDGLINLELARLAVGQGNAPLAIQDYRAALDGTWNGDGTLRRREVRLELARYLIAQHRYDEARSQLLVAAGNAAENHPLQIEAATLLEQAQGYGEAYDLFRRAASFRDTRTVALFGAGRSAAAQGHYRIARNMLRAAVAQPDFSHLPADDQTQARALLTVSENILDLFPSEMLPVPVRASRAADLADVARSGLDACLAHSSAAALHPPAADTSPVAAPTAGAPASPVPQQTLRSALGAVVARAQNLAGVGASNSPVPVASSPLQPAPDLTSLDTQWQALPTGAAALARAMAHNPSMVDSTLTLTYSTARATAQLCGAPTGGEPALLLSIANAPEEVEQP